jgi:hypothetical protein
MGTLMTLNIYGADSDYTGSETPDVTQSYFTSLSGLTSLAVNIYDGGFEPSLNSEETLYADNHSYVEKTIWGTYKVKLKHRDYPSSDTSIANYVPELAILKKAYTWIRMEGYKIGFETANLARAVNLISWNIEKFHNWTSYEFEFKFREAF